MSEAAVTELVILERLSCGECGIVFAVPAFWVQGRRQGTEGGNQFWCPNGHVRVFRDTDVKRLEKQLARMTEQRDWHKRIAEEKEKSLIATRAHVTRLRNRIQRGVCPSCQRSFTNLRRHMETKHPQLALPT